MARKGARGSKDSKGSKRSSRREERIERKRKAEASRTFRSDPLLRDLKPRERYVFHSDYFQIDDYYACILMFTHLEGAFDGFYPFWGVSRIPANMPEGVSTINFEQVRRMTTQWVEDHQTKAEGLSEMNDAEQGRAGTNTSRGRSARRQIELAEQAAEIVDGASYLNVHTRLLVKAPDLDTLELAMRKLERMYAERLATISVAPYIGDQRHELASLFARNEKKRGKGLYFTSTEYAGSYGLVTHGLEDAAGEYVGRMVSDVNTSAVVFDVDNYRHHVVIASAQVSKAKGNPHVSDMWGSKIGQSCLLNGGRVVHILMSDCDMTKLGPTFDSFTTTLDMNHGDVNMFEMFGDVKDELAIFASQMQKLVLMAEQASPTTEHDRSIIRGSLRDIATSFYIDQGMWRENAGMHREDLRVVGIPHTDVPRLQLFVSYLDMEYKALDASENSRDQAKLQALSILSMTFKNLLTENGDLFNKFTSPAIDRIRGARRIIYDFSDLMRRGHGIAMAQLVNVIDFALAQVKQHDVVIIHGAEDIDSEVMDYVNEQFTKLYRRGGRVAFLYNSVDDMIKTVDFNHFDRADYTVLGNMSDNVMSSYQKALGQNVPDDLQRAVTNKNNAVMYIRRGYDNVVFQQDLRLDPSDRSRRSAF
jgi:hypothetical protein